MTGGGPIIAGERVLLRPLSPGDGPALRAMVATPEVARWWGPLEGEGFPERDDPESVRFTILEDGEIVGMIQFWEEDDPHFRHATIDLFLAPSRHGRGLGPDAVRALAEHLVSVRGHHRLTIDPAAANEAAIKAYAKAGFEPVGVLRRAWCDPDGVWRDQLLMERVEPEPA